MRKTTKVTESSDLYRKIDALSLPNSLRDSALASAERIERMVATVQYLFRWFRPKPDGFAQNPKFGHQ
jgi:hypothetical protein